jgi:hypothetical protein
MTKMSVREFFRQPRRVQTLVKKGETLLVQHRANPVFEVRPANRRKQRAARRSRGIWAHKGYLGDPAAPLPPEESWQ